MAATSGVLGGRTTAGSTQFGSASDMAAIQAAGMAVLQALREGGNRLLVIHAQTQAQLSQVTGKVDASMRSISHMEKELEGAGQRYTFVQRFKEYVADLVDMLQDKSPLVEVLEEDMAQLAASRGQHVTGAAAAQGDADEMEAAQSAVAAALGVISRGGSGTAAGEAAEAAFLAAEAALAGKGLPMEMDEFGRDANLEARRDAQLRAEARRSRSSLPPGPGDGVQEAELGMETTDESEGEVSHYKQRRKEILELGTKVFADADDAFISIAAVKQRLEECKRLYRSAYQNAYVSDSAPALFAPFVRVQLLEWDPLYQPAKGFEEQPWFMELFDYGQVSSSGQGQEEGGGEDEDTAVVPRLVASLVLPLVLHRTTHCWTPASVRGSRAVAAVLEALLMFDLAQEKPMQELLSLVRQRLEDAVRSVALPSFPPPATQAHSRTRAILARRFGRAVRILGSLACFADKLDSAWLAQQALVKLVQQKLMPYLRSAAAEPRVALARLAKVVDAVPDQWIANAASGDVAELRKYVAATVRALHDQGNVDAAATQRLNRLLAHFPQLSS